jgi:hypothetical protein
MLRYKGVLLLAAAKCGFKDNPPAISSAGNPDGRECQPKKALLSLKSYILSAMSSAGKRQAGMSYFLEAFDP